MIQHNQLLAATYMLDFLHSSDVKTNRILRAACQALEFALIEFSQFSCMTSLSGSLTDW